MGGDDQSGPKAELEENGIFQIIVFWFKKALLWLIKWIIGPIGVPIGAVYISWDRYLQPALAGHNGFTLSIMVIAGIVGVFISLGFLLTHRAVAEGRFEAAAILATVSAVTENITVFLTVLFLPDTAFPYNPGEGEPREIRVIFAIMFMVLVALSVAHLVLANVRRNRTEQRVEEVLYDIMHPGTDGHRALGFLSIGKSLVQDDYFPGKIPQELFNTKRQNRKLFVELLRHSGDYNMEGVTDNTFLVMRPDQQPRVQSTIQPHNQSNTHWSKARTPTIDTRGHAIFTWASTTIALTFVVWMTVFAVMLSVSVLSK